MFKRTFCDCCGAKTSASALTQISDGAICPVCLRISNHSLLASVQDIKLALEENHRRYQGFQPNVTMTNIGCGYIFADMREQLCCFSDYKKPRSEPIVFRFSEILEYRLIEVGGKEVVKKKHGITRAVVGGVVLGPVGAVVGAATAKEETKKIHGTKILEVDLLIGNLKTTLPLYNPPIQAKSFFDGII